jgi:hypothetical protein
MMLSLSPESVSVLTPLAVGILGVVLVLGQRKAISLPDAPDPDREYRKLEMRLRHPWKARINRLMGD